MAESAADIGFGTLLQIGDGASPEVFTTIAEINSIDGPNLARETQEVTHMESPDQYREYIGGLLDGGEVSFEGNYVPRHATHGATAGTGLFSKFADGSVGTHNFKIALPGTPTAAWAFKGILTSLEPKHPHDDKMEISGTIKVSGKPVLTIAAS